MYVIQCCKMKTYGSETHSETEEQIILTEKEV